MKSMLALVGAMAVAACASAAPRPVDYGMALTSRITAPQYLTLELSGVPFCAGEVVVGKPLRCPVVPQPPTMVKVVWGPASSFSAPPAGTAARPSGWKVATGPSRQRNLAGAELTPPWWFRAGDVMLFTVNRMRLLSITYQCHRPGHECVSHIPVTIFGRPQGVTPLAP